MLRMAGLRALEILAEAKAIFFYKSVTITMVEDGVFPISLEFPAKFIHDHDEGFEEDVAFERRTCGNVWWLKLEFRCYAYQKPRVFACGDGWRAFVLDNKISVSDLLVFELVGFSRFLVHVYPPDASVPSYRYTSHLLDEDMSPARPLTPFDRTALELRFTKILYPSYLDQLDIPAHFWRYHGWDKFDGKLFKLEGLRKKGRVRALAFQLPSTKCYFGGPKWKSYCMANALKVRDMVSFTLTGPACFAVQLH